MSVMPFFSIRRFQWPSVLREPRLWFFVERSLQRYLFPTYLLAIENVKLIVLGRPQPRGGG